MQIDSFFSLLMMLLCIALPVFHLINVLSALPRKRFDIRSRENYLRKIPAEAKGISILIPCYNEQGILRTAIDGIRCIDYPNMEVIYINDGSTDKTMELLHTLLKLKPCARKRTAFLPTKPIIGFYQSERFPNIYVVDKINGGKADSLNAGISYATKELLVTLDADSILDRNALNIINKAFQDDNLIAAGGTVHILQGRSYANNFSNISLRLKNIVRLQILEYLKGFYLYKASLSKVHALAIISGAFGVFRRSVMLEVGGYRQTIGEDIDITLRFQKYLLEHKDKYMLFLPEAVCYTEVPENWRDLFKQRVRWQKAFIDCLIEFRGMLFRTLLKRSVSFFMVIDAFLVGTVSTYLALISFVYIVLNPVVLTEIHVICYVSVSFVYNLFYNIFGVYIATLYGNTFSGWNKVRLVITILLDLLIYRFVYMFFVAYGSVAYFWNKHDWSKVARTGRKYEFEEAIVK